MIRFATCGADRAAPSIFSMEGFALSKPLLVMCS